jgi:phosphocarrier protein
MTADDEPAASDSDPPSGDPPSGAAPPVISRVVTIANKRGLHARAAAKFATMAERFNASVDVHRDGQSVSARSIMGLMMLGAGMGATIELQAQGWDAREALDALAGLVEAGFDESG